MSNTPLSVRYTDADLEIFDDEEQRRFLADGANLKQNAWELLYRKEPELYERLIAGETIHPAVLAALPDADVVVEVAAGTGRLTSYLASRYARVIAVEPAAPLRARLEAKGLSGVDVVSGFFDALPVPDVSADLVVSCSALTRHPSQGGEAGLREMERVSSGIVAVVWPTDVDWLSEWGFTYESFDGEMSVDFGTLEEAVELVSIFYPDALEVVARRGDARVPYETLGMNPPRDWAWKSVR